MSNWIWPSSEEINDFPDPLGFEDEWRKWEADMSDDPPPIAAEIFAREHLQNSWDSIQDKLALLGERGVDPPENHGVSYRFLRLERDEALCFADRFGLSQHAKRFEGMDEEHRRQNRLSESRVAGGDFESIEILVASETCGQGMGGPWNTGGKAGVVSRLKSALMQTRSKKTSKAAGGSWGHGKKAIANASGCRTIAVYTCSDSEEDPHDDVNTRFLGVSYWKYHETGEWAHVGLGLLGNGDEYERGKFATTFLPREDGSADAFIQDLGLEEVEVRSPEDPADCGSTYLIIEPCFGPEDLVSALERNWWPLLERNPTTVSVIDFEGNDLEISPRERKELQPFLLANDIAEGEEPQRERGDAVHALTVDGKPVGKLSLTSDDGDGGWSYARPEDNRTLVALIRNDMVIAYEHFPLRRRRKGPFLRGTLRVERQENKEASEMLKMAEPHLHNVWKMDSGPSIPKDAANFAKGVLELTGIHVRDLRKALKEDDDTVATHFPVFSEIFSEGKEPSRSGGGGGGGGGSPRPFHIQRVESKPLPADPEDPTMIRFETTFEIFLSKKQLKKTEKLEALVDPGWLVREESGPVRDDSLLVKDSIVAPEGFEQEEKGFRGWVTENPIRFTWQSTYFPDDWKVAPDPRVNEVEDS